LVTTYTLKLTIKFFGKYSNIEDIGNTELRRCTSLSSILELFQDYTKLLISRSSNLVPKM